MDILARQMGHVVIGTPNMQSSLVEATEILGLQLVNKGKAEISLTSNSKERELTYISADKACVVSVGIEALNEEAWQTARSRCESQGVVITNSEISHDKSVKSFMVHGPSGLAYEFHTAHPRSQLIEPSSTGVRPKRLDHVNMTVQNPMAEYKFLNDIFGLGLSDRSDNDEVVFLHAADGFHHSIAFFKGESGLHHVSFEANHVHDLINLADRLAQDKRTLLWGPGHHGANAQSYFTYHLDQIGCMIEYSFGMLRIERLEEYRPGVWPIEPKTGEEWLNTWGAPPPGMYGEPRLPQLIKNHDKAIA